MTRAKTVSVASTLEELQELSRQEDELRGKLRRLLEERDALAGRLEKVNEWIQSAQLDGLREAPPDLVQERDQLAGQLEQVELEIGAIQKELEDLRERRIKLLREALPPAWRRCQEARERLCDPDLIEATVASLREAMRPFREALAEAREAEEELDTVLRASSRINPRAPHLLKGDLCERLGPIPDLPDNPDFRALMALVGRV